MLSTVWNYIETHLANNQVFSGGAVLMVGGALLAYARNAPSYIWRTLRRRIVLEIHMTQRDACFDWVVEWLAAQPYTKHRAMSLSATSMAERSDRGGPRRLDDAFFESRETRPSIILSPARGEHLMMYRHRLIWVSRSVPQDASGINAGSGSKVEELTVFILTRDRSLARTLLEEARDFAWPPEDDRVSMYRLHYDSWGQFAHRQPRPLKSVVLRDGLIESLIDDVKSFASRRDWYVERGVPYRRGYMLYGPPGTGKSSTVVAIASALKMHIAVLNLMSGGLSDDQLITALANPPDNSLILIEDIDCVFDENRDSHEDKKNSITFSGLLNAIDGVSAGEGRILFATTNHIDRIDPALIRPGRIDRRELIDYPNREQAERMFLRFFPNSDEHCRKAFTRCVNGDGDVRVSAAAIQAHLVKYSHSPILAASETHELYTTKDATT